MAWFRRREGEGGREGRREGKREGVGINERIINALAFMWIRVQGGLVY